MFKCLFFALIFISLNSSGQSKTQFTTKDFIELLVIAEREKFNRNTSTYARGSMEDPVIISRSPNGQPTKIRANYRIQSAYGNQEINKEKDWIEILYDNGLPFSLTFSKGSVFKLPNELSQVISEKFSSEEIQKIILLNKKYRENSRKSSASYQAVIKKHNSYPSSYNITNNIQKLKITNTHTTYTRVHKGNDIDGRDIWEEVPYTSTSTRDVFKNISNHRVVIKGILTKFDANASNPIIYEDASTILEPGQQIDELEVLPSFDDYYKSYIQYIGYLGDTKDGEQNGEIDETIYTAKRIAANEIEVDSYTNRTDIKFKKGDKIYFKTRGQIKIGMFAGSSTPVGIDGYTSYSKIKEFKHASLLGRMGDKDSWFLIGNGNSVTATKDGTLQVIVNDKDISDNSGSYYLEYSINTPLKNTNITSVASSVNTNALNSTTKKIDKPIRLKITTDLGIIVIKLYNETPLHRDNFVKLVKEHFYDGLLFHRVIKDFMIQGGDPDSRNAPAKAQLGNGGSNIERIPAEFNSNLIHKRGALAAARDGNPLKASNAYQFYIVEGKPVSDKELDNYQISRGTKYTEEQRNIYKSEGGVPFLDMQYTVFGELEKGMDVVFKIATSAKDNNNRPLEDIKMNIEFIE